MLPIGLQLYSVKNEMAKDFEGTIKKVAEMGYEGVEFAGLFGQNPEEIKAFCEEIGIVPISAHVPYYDMLENPEIAKTMNKLIPILNDIMELRRLEADTGDAESYLESITEIELYVSSVQILRQGLTSVKNELKSPAFTALNALVTELAEDEFA